MKNKLNVCSVAESLYGVIQEERIIFSEVIVSFIEEEEEEEEE
jgi:hypothetical protein